METFWNWVSRINVRAVCWVLLVVLLCVIAWTAWHTLVTPWETLEVPVITQADKLNVAVREPLFSWYEGLNTQDELKENPFASPYIDAYLVQEEIERIAREKAEAERLAAEKAEEERLAAEQAAAERAAAEKAEAERLAAEQAAREKAEAERLAAEKAETERLAAERAAAEQAAAAQGAEKTAVPAAASPQRAPAPAAKDVALVYRGMMMRTDGVVLALVENSTAKTTTFYGMEQPVAGLRITGIERQSLHAVTADGSNMVFEVNESRTVKEAVSGAQ